MFGNNPEIVRVIGDVRDYNKLNVTLQRHKVDYIIHTAALKRIDDMEWHPDECIKTNINSLEKGENTTLTKIEKFVDGAAVKRIGELTFEFCKDLLDGTDTICEGLICATILKVYNENAMVVEPAGALSIAALENHKEEIKGKTIVCVVSGGNNDITRMEEMKERALFYEGLKHYFIIKFPQRAGALKEFVVDVLGPNDDIVYFEYTKKHNRDKGPAVVGIELDSKDDFEPLITRMRQKGFLSEYLNEKPELFQFLI